MYKSFPCCFALFLMGAVATVSLAAPLLPMEQWSPGFWWNSCSHHHCPAPFKTLHRFPSLSFRWWWKRGTPGVVFGLYFPVAAPQGSMGVSQVWHSPGPAWAAPAGEEDDGGKSLEHSHRLGFPLAQVTVLCSQQLEDLLVLGLGQKFCNFVLRKLRGLTRGFHKALECVCISTSAWTMHWNYCIE